MPKKISPFEHYVKLQLMLLSKRNTPFKINPFVNCVRPFCKTSKLGTSVLFIRLRGQKYGLKIEIQNNSYFVITDQFRNYEFHLYCNSSKQLLQKLIYHNLLKP